VQVKAFDEELASDLEKISAFYAAKLAESTAEFGRLQTKASKIGRVRARPLTVLFLDRSRGQI